MADFTIKRGDTFPPVQATLSDEVGPINLTTATSVKFIAKGASSTITGTATIVTAASGVVKYGWAVPDTATVGEFSFEWEITWSGGLIETVPSVGYNSLSIVADLG